MCRVTPGHPMHDVLKRYWVPVARSEAVVAGDAPTGVTLFGDKYVVFRSPNGQLGMLDEACPHRRASLRLARNEDCGLRCIFHGWKFAADGSVLDIPSEPADSTYKDRITVDHFPVREQGDIVWAYLGQGEAPPFTEFGFLNLPADQRMVMKGDMYCNWVQVLEGNIDSSHVSLLHSTQLKILADPGKQGPDLTENTRPVYEINDTPYGFEGAAIREMNNGDGYVRVSQYVAPWTVLVAADDEVDRLAVMTVPVDDENTVFWFVIYNNSRPLNDSGTAGIFRRSVDANPDNFRESVKAEEMWGQRRDLMADGHWSGIQSLYFEDIAVQESSGLIVDRSRERLGSSDKAINRMRRQLLDMAASAPGDVLLGMDPSIDYATIEATEVVVGPGEDWREAGGA